VVCIIGYGRSGSTVLDTVLGNHPDMESFGELANVCTRGWTNDEYCACGERPSACPFWSRVRRRVREAGFPDDLSEYATLQEEFERARSLPRLMRERKRPSPEFLRYSELTRLLYTAISSESGGAAIVDSSKYAVRAFALTEVEGLDVRLVHLVRDPRGVVWSLLKSYERDDAAGIQRDIASRPARRSAWEWAKNNLAALAVRRLAAVPDVEIRYEDLVEDPVSALHRVGGVAGFDLSDLARRVAAGEEMEVGHTIAGNRVRMQGRVQLSADVEWREHLPDRDRRLVQVLTAPLMLRFGYFSRR